MRRALRRPVDDIELQRVINLVTLASDQGESYQQAIGLGLQSILVSPHFLFRVEGEDPAALNLAASESDSNTEAHTQQLEDLALASRLSFFLWSSAPDDELLDLASCGQLSSPERLAAQTQRLLADPRSSVWSIASSHNI